MIVSVSMSDGLVSRWMKTEYGMTTYMYWDNERLMEAILVTWLTGST